MSQTLLTILTGGFVAGVFDILDAFIFFGWLGAKPARVLQGIASGILGPASFQYGTRTVVLGGLLHFLIALTAAGAYYFASRRLVFLNRYPVAWGLVYGLAIYVFMNGLVLPLSRIPPRGPATGAVLINGVLALMLLVGLPIALIVSHSAPEARLVR